MGFQILPHEPNRVRFPGASFLRGDRVSREPETGHRRTLPDLIVEIASSKLKANTLFARIDDFQSAGVLLIWVVYSKARTIQVHAVREPMQELREGDALTGGDVLPGFDCPVAFA